MRIKKIIVRVQFEMADPEYLASQSCAIDCTESQQIRSEDVIDACQRAVAHCIEELENYLDN